MKDHLRPRATATATRKRRRLMDDIQAKRIEQKLDAILKHVINANQLVSNEEIVEDLTDEAFRLRAALNDLIGAIINKKMVGLEEDLEQARAALEFKDD